MADAMHLTGVNDPDYNLISILYHALQGAELYERYKQDAKENGDQELVDFFQAVQNGEREWADKARELLKKRFTMQEMGDPGLQS